MIDKLQELIKQTFRDKGDNKFYHSKEYFHHRLVVEKQRADRSSTQISVIILNLKPLIDEFEFSFIKKELTSFLNDIFKHVLSLKRAVDVVAWYDENTIGVLLCDTPYSKAQLFIDRLKNSLFQFFVNDYGSDLFLLDRIDFFSYTYPGNQPDDSVSDENSESYESNLIVSFNLNGQLSENREDRKTEITKRAIDIILSYIGIMLTAPVMVIIALLIKITSSGSVIFRQKRIGNNGKCFELFKFRTMYDDADETVHESYIKKVIINNEEKYNSESSCFKIPNDERMTPIGKFLRNTCLDELPQLVNVFRGEMSLVGPRPHPDYEVKYYNNWYHRRLIVKPGLTGLWQIQSKSKMRYSDAIRLDLAYIDKHSISLDFKILLYTLPTALAGFRSR